ncbi:MerR family transcriptional regulator [Harryflintia acetispora]|uniref:DNA-binding transcriptional MerR regulator n=1 Tax=Harryflintia acetispora TaxID=1849041 RepID=A0A9X8Y7X4_9FIRM|nr:MerR family transcriptional regulator [Harryflintia acetispora]TCL42785.1 DNA-binding transcriptional MerR regulator [Harryflintia acetispora]
MYRIGEFSKMSKTTIKTLRYYDEAGLLRPACTDPATGYRLYTTDQLVRLHRIQALRQVGLSIDEVRLILQGSSQEPFLQRRRAQLTRELSAGEDMLSRVEFMLTNEEDFFMNYQAIIKELPECIVYSKRMTIPSYDSYFSVIPAIGEQVSAKYPDLRCTTPEYCYVVYLDGEYRERDINLEFCEAVDQLKEDFEDIHFKKIAPVTAVSVMHKGPYAGLSQAYAFAMRWMEENGYTPTENPRESYIDGIWNKEQEADWLTELQFPIQKK